MSLITFLNKNEGAYDFLNLVLIMVWMTGLFGVFVGTIFLIPIFAQYPVLFMLSSVPAVPIMGFVALWPMFLMHYLRSLGLSDHGRIETIF